MKIKSIRLSNFRCIKGETIQLEDLTAMVGRNGAGKSTFLHAVEEFYDTSNNITEEDFFNRDIKRTIEIAITFDNLRDDEKAEFRPYIRSGLLIVTKKISVEKDTVVPRYYASTMQIPEFAEIRKIQGKMDQRNAWNKLIEDKKFSDLEDDKKATNSEQVDKNMEEYEASHQDLTKPIEKETQFFGATGVGAGKLDKYTKFVLVPAVKELKEEVRGGAIEQLIIMLVVRRIESREDIQKFKKEFQEKVENIYCTNNLRELPKLGKSISKELKKFSPGSELKLKWDEAKMPNIELPTPLVTLIEDDFEGEISNKGHGLQRALILTLLQQLAMAKPIEEEDSEEEHAQDKEIPPDLILAVEEPELFLHPSRCKYLFGLFFNLACNNNEEKNNNQIIYATHSPYFIDLDRFNNIRVIRKTKCSHTGICHSGVAQFSLKEAKDECAKICKIDSSLCTEVGFKSRAKSVMSVMVNEGFFADLVVIVEGLSEVGILYKLQEIKEMNWLENGIVVISANGKNNLHKPVIIFRGLGIPTYFIFDGDVKHKGDPRKEKATKDRNHICLRLAGVAIEDFPETKADDKWVVFKENMEDEIKNALPTGIFEQIRKEVALKLGYSKPKNAIKNIEGASMIIELIYKKGYSIPILESIAGKINSLYEAANLKPQT